MQGLYLQLIESATDSLDRDNATIPNPELLYWRGFARRRSGLFEGAHTDLQLLGNITGWSKFATASQLTTELGQLIAQRPPNHKDVVIDGKAVFCVYYDEDDEFLHTVMNALPKGYETATELVGTQTEGIPIFVFNSAHYRQFVKFFSTLSHIPLQGWWRIGNLNGTITVSQNNELEAPLAANCPDMLRLMSHEITHQLIHRTVGEIGNFPTWFNEGIARTAEAPCNPQFYAQNDEKIGQLLEHNAILPLYRVASPDAFYHSVEQMKKGSQQYDAYAQGLSMTRYLEFLLKDENLHSFLTNVQEKQCFEKALFAATGMTSEQFYMSWLAAVTRANN